MKVLGAPSGVFRGTEKILLRLFPEVGDVRKGNRAKMYGYRKAMDREIAIGARTGKTSRLKTFKKSRAFHTTKWRKRKRIRMPSYLEEFVRPARDQ